MICHTARQTMLLVMMVPADNKSGSRTCCSAADWWKHWKNLIYRIQGGPSAKLKEIHPRNCSGKNRSQTHDGLSIQARPRYHSNGSVLFAFFSLLFVPFL